MMTGTANSQQLFMQGKLKVKGAMSYAMKLGELQKLRPKGDAGAGKTSAMEPYPTAGSSTAADVFAMLGEELPKHPDVVSKVQGVYQWNITGDNAQKWVVDLKNGAGSVRKGEVEKSDCTITVSESDFVGMMTGTANSQQLLRTMPSHCSCASVTQLPNACPRTLSHLLVLQIGPELLLLAQSSLQLLLQFRAARRPKLMNSSHERGVGLLQLLRLGAQRRRLSLLRGQRLLRGSQRFLRTRQFNHDAQVFKVAANSILL